MGTDVGRRGTLVVLASGLLLLGGCASRVVARPDAQPTPGPRTSAEPTPPDGVENEMPLSENPSEVDVISQIVADRRRGDYPELELLESGFTITEQVPIRNDARTDYDRALGLLRQERYQEGITVLRSVVETTPDATAPYIDLAIAFGRVGDLEQAEQALSAAALLSPDSPVVHNELGIVYRKKGRFIDARASYERALAIFGDFHYARRNLAVLCDLYLSDLDCALANYRLYLDTVGSDPEVEIWVADVENRLTN